MSEADLLATIKGTFTPTPAILLGQAFGRVLERPYPYRVDGGYRCGDYTFSDETMREPLALLDRRGVFEAKGSKRYGDCTVVAKADYMLGAWIREFKTTQNAFDFDNYATSCQWRFMADIFEATKVTYDIFILHADADDGATEVRDMHSFDLFPYPELHQDCADLVEAFADYVRVKGLDGLLRERQARAMDLA